MGVDSQGLSLRIYFPTSGKKQAVEVWTDFSLSEGFLDPLGSFSFTLYPTPENFELMRERFAKGQSARLEVGGQPQMTGVVTTQTISMSRRGTSIRVDMKSMLAAPYEASVSPTYTLSSKSDIPISQLIMVLMAPYFYSSERTDLLSLTSNVGTDLLARSGLPAGKYMMPAPVPITTLKARQLKAKRGETVYSFISRIISRMGFILKTDAYGGLLLDVPLYGLPPMYTLADAGGSGGDDATDLMLDGITVIDSNDRQFSEVVVSGQALMRKPSGKGKAVNPLKGGKTPPKPGPVRANKPIGGVRVAGAVDVYSDDYANTNNWKAIPAGKKRMVFPYKSVAYKSLERGRHHYSSNQWQPYKPKYVEDKMSRDSARCEVFAELLLGLKSPGGFKITCSVAGFQAKTGALWTPNTVVRVKIDKLNIDEDMWIFAREFTASRGRGQITKLTLLPMGALVLGGLG